MSSVAAGGGFVNVHSFVLSEDMEVQVVHGFIAKKSKIWRLWIRSFHNNLALTVMPELDSRWFYVGIDVKLFQPEIADDHLQRLHILHNMSLVLSALIATVYGKAKEIAITRLNGIESKEHVIVNNYMPQAQAVHCQSKQQLLSAVKVYRVNLYGNDHDRQNLCDTVKNALTNFMDHGTDDQSRVLICRGNFPHFDMIDGLHSAFAIQFQQGEDEVGLHKGLNKKTVF
ncbi:hypothetical protein ACHAW5_006777 [Stephanodiscus triporus]|uniref:Uncharacterized protein n=1 Tax=Stephanodiscus triporus TaxID=2934178 RepID=A0ABD3NR90_9STRA